MKKTLLMAAALAAVTLTPGQTAQGQGTASNTVTLSAAPALLTFGSASTLTGQVTGADNAGVRVDLQEDAFPFGDMKNAGVNATTDAAGNFTFSVKPQLLTRYQVSAKAKPQVSSPIVEVKVRSLVTLAVNDATAKRGQRITFSGTVTPTHPGTVKLQRKIGTGAWRTIASPALAAGTTGNSAYTHTARVRRTATYRVRIAADADHARGTSPKRRVRVRR